MLQGLTAKILVGFVSGAGMMIIIRRLLKRKVPAMCLNRNSLAGKTVIITGANTGSTLCFTYHAVLYYAMLCYTICRTVSQTEVPEKFV